MEVQKTQVTQSKFKWVLGILFLPLGGFFLIPPINKFINEKGPSINYFGVETINKFNKQVIEKTNDWARFFIAFILISALALTSPEFQESYKTANSQPQVPAKAETAAKASEPIILKASPMAIENMKAFLNSGYELVDENKVYYTKSNDYNKVYFFGTLVINDTQVEPCIWVSNLEEFNNVMSANQGALNSTPVPDARKSDANVSWIDDGYLRIESKLAEDKRELSNEIESNRLKR